MPNRKKYSTIKVQRSDIHMLYWIVLILLILGIIAVLGGTFVTIKKNRAEDARLFRRRKGRRRDEEDYDEDGYPDDDDYDDEEDDYDERPRRRRSQRVSDRDTDEPAPRRQKRRRQWKIIMEDIDSWQKYNFIFYETVGIGRGKDGSMFEKYLSLPNDVRVSKVHCVIIHHGDRLYLKDEDSRNGTFLNGKRIDRPIVIQKDDVIGVGETRLEIQRILRESE